MQFQRAYSLIEIKAVGDDERVITGIATTPTPDRSDDIVESKGAEFKLPIPLLWQHRADQPIGEVFAAKVTSAGIEIKARILKTDEPGELKNRLDLAWQSIKLGLVRGLSIGFKSLEHAHIDGSYGIRFIRWLWLELSAVTIAANGEASITSIKSIDARDRAASGEGHKGVVRISARAAAGSPAGQTMAKTIAEQKSAFQATLTTKQARMTEIMQKAADEGVTLDEAQKTEYDTLKTEVAEIKDHLVRLADLEEVNKALAKPAAGANPQEAAAARGGRPVITVNDNIPKGIGFARYTIAAVAARKLGMTVDQVAKQRWPDHAALHQFITKATIPGALTTNSDWLGNLVDPTNLAAEFVEYLRPETIVGKFGTTQNGVAIPPLRNLPFNIRITGQTTGAVANWVGQGKPKPVTSFATNAQTLLYTKIAAIAVLPQEVIRFSTPSAEKLVRDELKRAVVERMDIDFVDPAQAAVANVSPASITNGVSAMNSAGTSEANIRTDISALLAQFIENNVDVSGLVLIMPNTLAMAASIMVNSLGQPSFPGLGIKGGTLLQIPVIASQYAGNQSGYGNMVIAVNANDIGLADDGEVTIDASTEASIQMSDAPTNDAATGAGQSLVSMFQTNSVAVLAERFVNWAKLRSTAVSYIDDVNWGSVGSPN